MTTWQALARRAGVVGALLVAAPACGGERDEAFELGSGAFPWSDLTLTAFGELEPVAESPTAPPSEWGRAFSMDECYFTGIVYGIGWPIPCDGSAAARVDGCAPDPDRADTELCRVTLESLELTLRPDFEEPVIDAATVELVSPVVADEAWSWSGLGGSRTSVTSTLTITGRDGGAPTHYGVTHFELALDYVSSVYVLEVYALKPGW